MRSQLRSATIVSCLLSIACALALVACSDEPAPQNGSGSTLSGSSAATSKPVSATVPDEECGKEPPAGPVDHSLQDFAFTDGVARVSVTEPGSPPTCYSYLRWGNADPSVAIDSQLYLFKSVGSDGLTIDMLVGDLTLVTTLNARITVVFDGAPYQSDSCAMTITALSSAGVAGEFTCPTAIRVFGNPFAPLDDLEPEPIQSTPLPTVTMSGWFSVAP
jgi:hypothetical protein